MAEPLRSYQTRPAGVRVEAEIDQGLRAYMLKVYNLMALGLAITGLAAWGAFNAAARCRTHRLRAADLRRAFRWVIILPPGSGVSSCRSASTR
jgi:FtsH-binding integral membrane protein